MKPSSSAGVEADNVFPGRRHGQIMLRGFGIPADLDGERAVRSLLQFVLRDEANFGVNADGPESVHARIASTSM